MANPIAMSNPVIALTVLKESITLAQSIMQYRQQTMQTELAREAMHQQANMHTLQIQRQFDKDIALLDKMSEGLNITLKSTTKEMKMGAKMIKGVEKQIKQLIEVLAMPNLPPNQYQNLSSLLDLLIKQQSELILKFNEKGSDAVSAFSIYADSLRTSPRVFTDVS